jgi:hypothetical protein
MLLRQQIQKTTCFYAFDAIGSTFYIEFHPSYNDFKHAFLGKNSYLFPKASKKYQYLTFKLLKTLYLYLKRQKSINILVRTPLFDTKSPVYIGLVNKVLPLKRQNSINKRHVMTFPIASEVVFIVLRQ